MIRSRPIFDAFPALDLPWCELGDFPTPVQSLEPVTRALSVDADAWVKRDDLSSDVYGGNKVRTLEVLFADALNEGASHIISTGAFGTNHGAATVLHAPRVGLTPGLLVFPQPASKTALANFEMLTHAGVELTTMAHWSGLPFRMSFTRIREKVRGRKTYVMVPGGATPLGTLGYVNAALELAHQIDAGECPAPRAIVLAVGSTCTSAGLLLGTRIAARMGLGWTQPPKIISVRVTPWPVTSPVMITRLAARASALLEGLTGEHAIGYAELRQGLEVDPHELGRGYGFATSAGLEAIRLFSEIEQRRVLQLDTTYSGKAGASLIRRMRSETASARGPWLFWSTKSTAPLPEVTGDADSSWIARSWTRRARS